MSKRCPNCDSMNLRWQAGVQMAAAIANGRYNAHDATPVLFLGCDECSETVRIIDAMSRIGESMLATIPTDFIDEEE